jgi:hypothetical protein
MNSPRLILLGLCALLLSGCASTKITDREIIVKEKLARPGTIWVYDFATTPEEIPDESALAGNAHESSTTLTAEQIAIGKKLGAQIATELVTHIEDTGLSAARASAGTRPQLNDIVIRGYLFSIEEGNALKRVAIGFGSGDSELKVAAEGFQMTSRGLRKLGSGKTDATGAKTPGGALGAAALIATHNPLGLIVGTGVKIYGEKTGKSKVEGRATATAKEIAVVLDQRFKEQGWIN